MSLQNKDDCLQHLSGVEIAWPTINDYLTDHRTGSIANRWLTVTHYRSLKNGTNSCSCFLHECTVYSWFIWPLTRGQSVVSLLVELLQLDGTLSHCSVKCYTSKAHYPPRFCNVKIVQWTIRDYLAGPCRLGHVWLTCRPVQTFHRPTRQLLLIVRPNQKIQQISHLKNVMDDLWEE